MRKIIAIILCLLFLPAAGWGDYRGHGYYHGPPHGYYGPRAGHYGGHYHHGDDWVVPLVIVGGLLGVMALSQMPAQPPPPPPPQRICRDTYDYYDQFGRYLYSRYVDRPCY